jgi:hypothetical protein
MTSEFDSEEEAGCASIFGAPILALVLLLNVCNQAYCMKLLWRWFAVPEGLPAYQWKSFAGLLLLTWVLRQKSLSTKDDRDGGEVALAIAMSILFPWLCLAVGWLIKP